MSWDMSIIRRDHFERITIFIEDDDEQLDYQCNNFLPPTPKQFASKP
jgi:hypothetical protein